MRIDQPLQQASRNVQRNGNLWIVFEDFEKRGVAVPIRIFTDTLEVSDRLVIVNRQDKPNRGCHGKLPFLQEETAFLGP